MIKIKLCLSYEEAVKQGSLLENPVAIETEYGDKYYGKKDGAVLELLHHGSMSENKPASMALIEKEYCKYNNFVISHIDLDTVFGIMWTGGYLKKSKLAIEISKLVAYVDTHGFYIFKKEILNMDNPLHIKFLAITSIMNFWKISQNTISKDIHKLILRIRDYIILDIPEEVKKYILVNANDDFLQKVTESSLTIPKVLVTYITNTSVTDKYFTEGIEYDMILQYNTGSNSITLACRTEELAIRYFGKDGVIDPLRSFFGNGSGGHKTIGGTPRENNLQIEMLEAFFKFLKRSYLNI